MTQLSDERVVRLGDHVPQECIKKQYYATALARFYTNNQDCTDMLIENLDGYAGTMKLIYKN